MYDLLEGLRVVEGSAFVAAPLGGMTLAQLGAEVIRFDPPGGGLDFKRWPLDENGRSLYWAGLNKAKKSFAVDIKKPEGRELVAALITQPGSDRGLFLTNHPPGGPLDHTTLVERRSDLITLNVLGHHDGAPAVDYTVNSAVGFPFATGPVGTEGPVNHVLAAWDLVTGATAATGLLAAERRRSRTGEGGLVTLALSDVAIATACALGHTAEAELLDRDRPRDGNHVFGAFGHDFRTADNRWIFVIALTRSQWGRLVRATGIGDAVADLERRRGLDLGDESDRWTARDAIVDLISPWVVSKPLSEVTEILTKSGVLWGPYRTFRQMLAEDPRASVANPMLERIVQPGIGSLMAAGSPLDFRALARRPIAPAPRLGEHTDHVLLDLLGLPEREVGRLHDMGIVSGPEK